MAWTPTPLAGNPFEYPALAVSAISATEAFQTSIDLRDGRRCVVCGLQHCHIILEGERHTWQTMKQLGFVPQASKSVAHGYFDVRDPSCIIRHLLLLYTLGA